eukprot:2604454-Prymnesium_polylepis.1
MRARESATWAGTRVCAALSRGQARRSSWARSPFSRPGRAARCVCARRWQRLRTVQLAQGGTLRLEQQHVRKVDRSEADSDDTLAGHELQLRQQWRRRRHPSMHESASAEGRATL